MGVGLLIDDLVKLGKSIYIQDCITKVTSAKRILNIKLTVSDAEVWNKQKKILSELVNFMSHDELNIEFIQCVEKLYIQEKFNLNSINHDASTLLSGGLDSLCGVDYNIKNNINSIYCSYKINTFESRPIAKVGEYIRKKHNATHYVFPKIEVKKIEWTQRTRSFYFICLGCYKAFENNINVVNVYENGIMSLNPGLSSRTPTRTTHPKTIKLINQLLNNLGINIKVEHPFIFRTKGEMINDLSDEFKSLIKITNTCGMSRQNKNLEIKTGHCGACVPCLLRQISISAYNNEKYDSEYDMKYNYKDKKLYPYLKSSYAYYKEFYEKIKDGSIYLELDIKKNYYEDDEYLDKTERMLNKFSEELEIFFQKYPID